MKKKRSFTLIELLAIIAILAIILAIAAPKVLSVIYNAKLNAYQTSEESMNRAAQTYLSSNQDLMPNNVGDTIEVSLENLIAEKYIDEIKDPFEGDDCSGYVLITKLEDGYSYNPELKCGDANEIKSSQEDELVGHWILTEETDLVDLSGKKNKGKAKGNVDVGENATAFDGVDDYVDISEVADDMDSGNSTICIKLNGSNQDHKSLASFNTVDGENVVLFMPKNGKAGLFSTSWKISDSTITNSSWKHTCYTYNNLTKRANIYVDGKKSYEFDADINYNFDNLVSIGQEFDGELTTDFFEGLMSEVKIYNRSLSEDEIRTLYAISK